MPYRMNNMAAALVGDVIYVAGGKADEQLANKFISLDLSMIGSDNFNWRIHLGYPAQNNFQSKSDMPKDLLSVLSLF